MQPWELVSCAGRAGSIIAPYITLAVSMTNIFHSSSPEISQDCFFSCILLDPKYHASERVISKVILTIFVGYCSCKISEGFCWSGRSFTGVDPVVYSHTWPCGHFTSYTKKKKNSGWKEETDMDLELQTRESEVSTLKHSYVHVHGHRENSAKISHSYQKC